MSIHPYVVNPAIRIHLPQYPIKNTQKIIFLPSIHASMRINIPVDAISLRLHGYVDAPTRGHPACAHLTISANNNDAYIYKHQHACSEYMHKHRHTCVYICCKFYACAGVSMHPQVVIPHAHICVSAQQ